MDIHSYPSIYQLGHRYVSDIFKGEVAIEEKVDGSQISFGIINGELQIRSKRQEINLLAPEKLFKNAVEVIKALPLREGYVYRGEYLSKPKHNSLTYERVPNNHIILFDVEIAPGTYLQWFDKYVEANRLGLETVPLYWFKENCTEPLALEAYNVFFEAQSILGGPIEGVVIKNYSIFGEDKNILTAKYVRKEFQEIHRKEWRKTNPTSGDIIEQVSEALRTDARREKAVQHLREQGLINGTPQDIPALMKELGEDLEREAREFAQEELMKWAWPKIKRSATRGFAEWYKDELFKNQFGEVNEQVNG